MEDTRTKLYGLMSQYPILEQPTGIHGVAGALGPMGHPGQAGPAGIPGPMCPTGPPDTSNTMGVLPSPTTKQHAEHLCEMLLNLPDGFLAYLYKILYEGRGLRIDSAQYAADKYIKGLA